MINAKDVVRMKIPYPDISADLAVSSHMYICKSVCESAYEYVKCQTLKPKMLAGNLLSHYVDEEADKTRNPFQRTTRIDCDKVFTTKSVQYDSRLKTTVRPDICQELYEQVMKELAADGYVIIEMNEEELTGINPMITKIQE